MGTRHVTDGNVLPGPLILWGAYLVVRQGTNWPGPSRNYEFSTELPSKLLALIRKLEAAENKSPPARSLIGTLDAVEGYYLRRYAPPVEPRCISAGDDWPLCT